MIVAVHLDATKNAADIPGLFDETYQFDHPIGVIVLAAAAVRVFELGLLASSP